jgi:hypothetical protein
MLSSGGWKVMAVLALVQGALGILRALQWVRVGADLSQTGVVLLPILGLAAFARAALVGLIALLYVLFAWGVFGGKGWARGVGLAACVVNGLSVIGLLLSGHALGAALVWAIVPVLLGVLLLAGQPTRAQ